ncbi:shikimate dehydrogenase family protein [Zhouia sp. PK063]|uniref:shikimate dehydrogenase family protein n=1 Tax=Zhouia sp. PK063 TaxID=3373602 RepID=UPI0037AB1516
MSNKLFGLIGKNISYSFSRGFFSKKFEELHISNTHSYVNFDIDAIEKFTTEIINQPNLVGCNVTIPYKQDIIPFLDELDNTAKEIGAVNTIKFIDGKKIGYNTDCYGFMYDIEKLIKPHHKKALILGTGGASKAIAYALNQLGVAFTYVSRNPKKNEFSYHDLNEEVMSEYLVIINCSPVGTFPQINDAPNIPYQYITPKHLAYDLIYNPAETAFLKKFKEHNATICNGMRMLELQAEKAWSIWNS